ncbi:putative Methyl-CpG-binding domain-containing protein [Helianthus annuus]|uniref:Methyl-CpG-binding domain-containing protein n=1 Tax=Helianthus annuus TaxID=4232 RepID=A0A9K3JKJ9_HELAN|nr:methyl-CpG-binding domain-containing protein 13 isoform X1 [Helianthus annuus]KAF5816085.1 putative Methyl-CpG-binding domain-containing protein [Helianthus annuus]KAJ0769534.1 putative Methyl-CpG-binding domain-containing protein [Helianthus annuus]KAJ0945356.1 putative Methyl-CpG-binding domain-containing protein [Helianthus annuus]
MSHDDWPDWLPGDWSVHIRKVDGRKVKCYVDPDGHKCYSKPQVFDYLKKTNKSLPTDKPQNGEGPAIDLSAEPNAPHTDEGPESTPGGPPTKLTPRSNRRKSISADLSEDFLGGDGFSSEPSSHKRHRGDCNWLPEGWTVEDKVRQGGSTSGMKYKVYIDPVSGQKFFSKPQVLNHIAKTNGSAGVHEAVQEAVFAEPISAMPISSWQEKPTTEPDDSQMYEATEAEKKTEDKTEISRLSSDDEVVTRTPAEGLPPGWIKEVRRRKSSGGAIRSDPVYYLDPLSEYAFASKKDALRYLESGDIKTCVSRPRKKNMNNNDTLNVNLTSTGGELPAQTDQSNGNEASKEFVNGSAEELKTNESGIPNPKPLRSISGASFSTPEKDKWLPDGWLVDVRYKTSGMKYKIYKDPATGKLFYSKPQVLSYLGNGSSSSSRKKKEHNSSVAPDSSPNSTPADVTRPKRSVKKKGDSQNTEYQEVITTSAADGLPPGWIKETRTKIYATHKRNDPFYTDPETGYIFRSKADALRYIETGDVNLCAIRPKVKDKDGKEVYVYSNNAQKPTTGDDVATEVPEENHTPDPKTANDTNRRVTKNSSPATDSPSRSSKRQKGKDPETAPTSGVPTEKQETGVNLEKQPDDGNLTFDIPEDDNWTDQCIDFAVKTLTDEIMFNGQPVETTGVKDTPPSKVN